VYVAVGDVTGDGKDDLVTAAGEGGGPHVGIFNGATMQVYREFLAWDSGYSGGVRVAVGDLTGDGKGEIILAQGSTTSLALPTWVRVFNAENQALLKEFQPYGANFTSGAYVAAGDVNGDGRADLITGAGQDGGPHVKICIPHVKAFTPLGTVAGGPQVTVNQQQAVSSYSNHFFDAGVNWKLISDSIEVTGNSIQVHIRGVGANINAALD
jgi:hypothetical protein